ncbi:hypothetical protein CSC34_1939 [Pseudomonas aeruginosa]|nr:hypothetical protein CSC34_1939 [Pseudomonas aeruginosa]
MDCSKTPLNGWQAQTSQSKHGPPHTPVPSCYRNWNVESGANLKVQVELNGAGSFSLESYWMSGLNIGGSET